MITISNWEVNGDDLYVTGIVDGKTVQGHGFTSRFNTSKTPAHKLRYLQDLLRAGSEISIPDTKLIQKVIEPSLKPRIIGWLKSHIDHFAISCVVSIGVTLATHPVVKYLPQLLHLIHLNPAWFGF
jgi:hypothetical protein